MDYTIVPIGCVQSPLKDAPQRLGRARKALPMHGCKSDWNLPKASVGSENPFENELVYLMGGEHEPLDVLEYPTLGKRYLLVSPPTARSSTS